MAVKVLKDQNPSEREMGQFQREIDMMNKLRHKNIVNFIGAVRPPPIPSPPFLQISHAAGTRQVTVPGKLCMVTEFAKHGSLQVPLPTSVC